MNTIFCYIYPDMADFEVTILLHRLRNAGGRRILCIAEDMQPVTSQSGLRYLPDLPIADAQAEAAEALIIPGGPIDPHRNAILPLLRAMHGQGKLIAAICFGPQFAARAGLLAGRRYATSCTPQMLAAQGLDDPFPRATQVDRRVVRDGNLITAQGHALVDFAQEVCRYLRVYPTPRQEYNELGKLKESEDTP